ncbi:MAG: hypothetical protein Q9174_006718, partial [Haloplaca sp. 1 TL-2023]
MPDIAQPPLSNIIFGQLAKYEVGFKLVVLICSICVILYSVATLRSHGIPKANQAEAERQIDKFWLALTECLIDHDISDQLDALRHLRQVILDQVVYLQPSSRLLIMSILNERISHLESMPAATVLLDLFIIDYDEEKERKLKATVKTLNVDLKESKSQISDLEARVVNGDEERRGLRQDKSDLTAEKEDLAGKNGILSAEKEALASRNKTLLADNEALTKQVATLSGEKEDLASRNGDLSAEKEALESRNETLVADNEALTKQVVTISGEKEALAGEIGILSADNKALSNHVINLAAKDQALSSANAALETSNRELGHKKHQQATSMENLQRSLDSANAERNQVQEQLEASKTQYNQLSESHATVTAEKDVAVKELGKVQTENALLQSQAAESEKRRAALVKKCQDHELTIADMKTAKREVQERHKEEMRASEKQHKEKLEATDEETIRLRGLYNNLKISSDRDLADLREQNLTVDKELKKLKSQSGSNKGGKALQRHLEDVTAEQKKLAERNLFLEASARDHEAGENRIVELEN